MTTVVNLADNANPSTTAVTAARPGVPLSRRRDVATNNQTKAPAT